MKFRIYVIALALLTIIASTKAKVVCTVYFTGIGCPHCAKTDPYVLDIYPKEFEGKFVVIEYEIYQQSAWNGELILSYSNKYGSRPGVPLIFFTNEYIIGDYPILDKLKDRIDVRIEKGSECPLKDGSSIEFSSLKINQLPGLPKIWIGEKVLIKRDNKLENIADEDLLKILLANETFKTLKEMKERGLKIEETIPQPVPLSGKFVYFQHASLIGKNWLLEWNEEIPSNEPQETTTTHIPSTTTTSTTTTSSLPTLASTKTHQPFKFPFGMVLGGLVLLIVTIMMLIIRKIIW